MASYPDKYCGPNLSDAWNHATYNLKVRALKGRTFDQITLRENINNAIEKINSEMRLTFGTDDHNLFSKEALSSVQNDLNFNEESASLKEPIQKGFEIAQRRVQFFIAFHNALNDRIGDNNDDIFDQCKIIDKALLNIQHSLRSETGRWVVESQIVQLELKESEIVLNAFDTAMASHKQKFPTPLPFA